MKMDIPESRDKKIQYLNERLARMAQEKSFLQLTLHLINKIVSASGLDNVTDNILLGVLNGIGGTNIALYYYRGGTLHYADITGVKKTLAHIDYDQVGTVFKTGDPLEQEFDFNKTQMTTADFTKAFTWIYPLRVGSEVVGVLRIDHLHISLQSISSHIVSLFSFIAMALKNEIQEQDSLDRASKKQQISEDRFEKLFMEAPLGIAVVNTLTGRIYEVNPMFAQIVDRTMEELTQIDWMSITHADDIQEDLDNRALLNAGKINGYQMEKRYLRRDGSPVWINMIVSKILVPEQSPPCNLCMIENIEKRKQAEEMMLQLNANLEAKNQELDRFTYTVSHDLKSPLVTIQGFTGLIEQSLGDHCNEEVQSSIDYITRATSTMYTMIDDLLALSRIGHATHSREPVSLAEVVQEALDWTANPMADHPATVKVSQDLPRVIGDYKRLREMMQNLIENAIKYMGEQPSPCIEIGATDIDGQRACYVRDNGIGILPQHHEKVFDLFERLSPDGEGTGVGLAKVRRIIQLHGGRIWIESTGEAGRGATFWFTLPLAN